MSLDPNDLLDPADPALTPVQQLNRIKFTRAVNRRKFLAGLGATSAAVAGAGLLIGCGDNVKTPPPVVAAGVTEADILNFALNLEYLEAQFYLFATTGVGLSVADMGTGAGTVSGGVQTTFTDPQVMEIAQDITGDEVLHVELLRSALAASAVSMPDINLAALGSFATQTQFLTIARAFEDTGVSAYAGAATGLTGSNLQTAAQILGTEAFHASAIRLKLIELGITVTATDSQDVVPARPDKYFAVDANALAIKRNTSQVLQIVYANTATGVSAGGFYPKGLNGTIKTT